jgi:hypothetical protein
LEEEFRAELEEKQHIIAALNTKVGPGSNRYTLGGGGRGGSRAQSVLQHWEEEFRLELKEKQHIIAALNTKVGPGQTNIYQRVQGSKCTSALGGGRAGGGSSTQLGFQGPEIFLSI